MNDTLIHTLEEKLQGPLPGIKAQYKMAHVIRRHYGQPPPDAKLAGVLALFYPKTSAWHIVLIERALSHPDDRHGGQISFPGGKYEEGDNTLANTALREAREEIGINPDKVKLIGKLTDLYIPVSNFLVKPYVGYTNITPDFQLQLSEVSSILEIPFELLKHPATCQKTDLQLAPSLTLRNVPCFSVFNKTVWGATAMMLNELLEVIQ